MKFLTVLSAVVGGALSVGAVSAPGMQKRAIGGEHLNKTDHPVSLGVKNFAEIPASKCSGKPDVREFAGSRSGNVLQRHAALRGA